MFTDSPLFSLVPRLGDEQPCKDRALRLDRRAGPELLDALGITPGSAEEADIIRRLVMDLLEADYEFHGKIRTRRIPARTLIYRVFNRSSWNLGGRLYGPWWQNLPKEERAKLLIDGEPTLECDYSSIHPQIIFARQGEPFDFDPYLIDGFTRDEIKLGVLIALNVDSERGAVRPLAGKLIELKEHGFVHDDEDDCEMRHHGPRSISYSRNGSRYTGMWRYYGKTFSYKSMLGAVERLKNGGFIYEVLAEQSAPVAGKIGHQSTITATGSLIEITGEKHVNVEFVQGELIRKKNIEKQIISYPESDYTRGLRREMRTINKLLASVQIELPGSMNGHEIIIERQVDGDDENQPLDPAAVKRAKQIIDAISAHAHPVLAAALFTGIGIELQAHDSRLIVDVLLAAQRKGIVCLPIHDSIVARKREIGQVEELMKRHFHARFKNAKSPCQIKVSKDSLLHNDR